MDVNIRSREITAGLEAILLITHVKTQACSRMTTWRLGTWVVTEHLIQ